MLSLVAKSEKMQAVLKTAEKVAPTNANVLITGESGTGKNLLAEFIHEKSPRCVHKLVKIDCASLPKELVEAELFGYEKGSFTGATETKIGWLEIAHKSTLLLDEIALLPFDSQAKLLRVLEQREFERLGGRKTFKIDVRVIATTNVELEKAVAEKRFREDLFFRLNVVRLQVPPLRERREDIPDLIESLLKFYGEKHGRPNLTINESAVQLLQSQMFAGNIRELSNLIERAIITSNSDRIEPTSFPAYLQNFQENCKKWHSLAEISEKHIRETLIFTKNNKTEAAELLGISRKNLYEKLKRYKIDF